MPKVLRLSHLCWRLQDLKRLDMVIAISYSSASVLAC